MSLLNDMLKDLNNRAPSASAPLTLPPLNHRTKIQIGLMYCAAPILLLSGLIYFITRAPSHAVEKMPSPSLQINTQKTTQSLDPIPFFSDVSKASTPNIDETKPDDALVQLNAQTPDLYETQPDDSLEQAFVPVEKKIATLTPEEWHDEHLNKAFEAIEEGDNPKAIRLLNTILTQFPASIETRENLAALYIDQNELSLAYDVLDKGLEFDPHNFRLLTMKSRLLVEEGQHREALALLEQFRPDIRKEPDYYGVMAAIFEALGRSGEAGSLYQSLVKIEPSNGQYWLGYGIALENKNANQQAIEAYKRASQSDNAQPVVRAYAETRLKTLQG
ncbi:tetratricopeptide repeat protein [bacterium]|nr:tetratricopeptide repeat protein [bacterium]